MPFSEKFPKLIVRRIFTTKLNPPEPMEAKIIDPNSVGVILRLVSEGKHTQLGVILARCDTDVRFLSSSATKSNLKSRGPDVFESLSTISDERFHSTFFVSKIFKLIDDWTDPKVLHSDWPKSSKRKK